MSDIFDEKYNGLSMADLAKMANLSQNERAAILAKAGQTAAANPQGAGGRPDAGGLSSAVFDIMKQIEEQAGKKSDEYWGKNEHGILATLKKVGRVGQELGGAVLKGGPIFGPLMYEGKAEREKRKITDEFKALAPTVDRDILGQQADATRNANAQLAAKAKADAEAQKFQIEQAKLLQNAPKVLAQSEKFQAETKRINAQVASGIIDAEAGIAKQKLAYIEATGQMPGTTTSDQMNAAAMNGIKPQDMTGAQMGAGTQGMAAAKAIPAMIARQAAQGPGTTRVTNRETPEGWFTTRSTTQKGGMDPQAQQAAMAQLTGMTQMGQQPQGPPQGPPQSPAPGQQMAQTAQQAPPQTPIVRPAVRVPGNVNPLTAKPLAAKEEEERSAAQQALSKFDPQKVKSVVDYGVRDSQGREYGKDMVAGAVNQIADYKNALSALTDLEKRIKAEGKESMGPFRDMAAEGRTGSIAQALGIKAPAALNANLRKNKQLIAKPLEGGMLREGDELKYDKILPVITDQPDIALGKVQDMYGTIAERIEIYLLTQKASGRKVGTQLKEAENLLTEVRKKQASAVTGTPGDKPKVFIKNVQVH